MTIVARTLSDLAAARAATEAAMMAYLEAAQLHRAAFDALEAARRVQWAAEDAARAAGAPSSSSPRHTPTSAATQPRRATGGPGNAMQSQRLAAIADAP